MVEENNELFEELLPWFELKISDFAKEGYPHIELTKLYLCFKDFVWKHSMPQHYYQRVSTIMKFNVNQYFDYESLEAQVTQVSSLDDINFDDFL